YPKLHSLQKRRRSGSPAVVPCACVQRISTPTPPPFFSFQSLLLTPSPNLLCGMSDRVDIHAGSSGTPVPYVPIGALAMYLMGTGCLTPTLIRWWDRTQ